MRRFVLTAVVGVGLAQFPHVMVVGQVPVPQAVTLTETVRLEPSGLPDSHSGWSVAASGDRLLVGTPGEAFTGLQNHGMATLYVREGGNWVVSDGFLQPAGAAGDRFGHAVDIDGDLVVVGAPYADDWDTDCGAAHVYRWDAEVQMWMFLSTLALPEGCVPGEQARFGAAVAVSGDWIAVGAPGVRLAGADKKGSVSLYHVDSLRHPVPTDPPAPDVVLTASDGVAGDLFGESLDLSGGTLAVGSPAETRGGGAYAFSFNGTAWQEAWTSSRANENVNDKRGWDVAVDGDLLVVASYQSTPPRAYYFDGSTWADDGMVGSYPHKLSRVAIRGTTIVASSGYSGEDAEVWVRHGGDLRAPSTWDQQMTLQPSDGQEDVGSDVAITESFMVVGAHLWDPQGGNPEDNRGAVYVYDMPVSVHGLTPSAGPLAGGTTVRLWGQGFVSGASVTVGGTAATNVVVASDTTLTAVFPGRAVPETVDVVVTNPGGSTATLEDAFTYADTNLKALPFTSPLGISVIEQFTVTVKIGNNGLHAAPPTVAHYYLSTNNRLELPEAAPVADVYLGRHEIPAIPAKGTHESVSPGLSLPRSTAPGTYFLFVYVDAEDAVREKMETDNAKGKRLKVGCDLMVSKLIAPRVLTREVGADITTTTINKGPGATISTTTRLLLSVDKVAGIDDVVLVDQAVNLLFKGESHTITTTVTVPGAVAAGKYYLLAVADAGGVTAETVETNNVRVKPVTIQ